MLNVKCTATIDEIKNAYFSIAKKLHPDVNKAPDAKDHFDKVCK